MSISKVREYITSEEGEYVYDISLDGTVVNACGMNIMSNTDGFNFLLPDPDMEVDSSDRDFIVPCVKNNNNAIFNDSVVFCVKKHNVGDDVCNETLKEIIENGENVDILTRNGWINISNFEFIET